MIQWEENNLAYLASVDFIGNNEVLFSFFKEKEGFDLILDCNTILPNTSDFMEIFNHQQKVGYCFVLILSPEQPHNFPSEWIIVPTKTEALDFISFEQMQRDLGF